MERLLLLESWLRERFRDKDFTLSPASADASFRRYFRVTFTDGTFIAMDAPPEQEDCAPFLRVAGLFSEAGANVPAILAQDVSQGFLLLADLGSTTYLQALNGQPDQSGNEAHQLYSDAVGALLKIQLASRPDVLPDYDEALLSRELHLFPDWYLEGICRSVSMQARKWNCTGYSS